VGPTGPTEERGAKTPGSSSLLEARPVRITELSFGYTPRQSRLDEEHVKSLVEVIDRVPPIIVEQRTMTVIDGLHRTEAARRAGHREIAAVIFAGSEIEALALAIKANVGHGKPLTREERRAAAGTLLTEAPQRSDRWVAEVCGLSHTTVARIREGANDKGPFVRTGRDGRSRPIDNAPGQAAVAHALADNPRSSLRRAAQLAGVSPNTARRVGKLVQRNRRNPDPSADPAQGGEEPLLEITRSQAELSWWKKTDVLPADIGKHLRELPTTTLSEAVDECRRRAHTWLDIAEDIERRATARGHGADHL
jgi:ParB-like chromosome segregation protein Spo0J